MFYKINTPGIHECIAYPEGTVLCLRRTMTSSIEQLSISQLKIVNSNVLETMLLGTKGLTVLSGVTK